MIPAGQDTPLTLVFENGYALPLLCPDCGGPQHHRIPAEDVLAEIAGLRLIGLGYAPVDDDGPEALLLHLSSRADAEPNDEDVLTLATHAHSVTHLESINQTPPPQMSRRRRRGGKSERRR
ncbi:MAG: hypothetical protein HY260_19500 [Chloroflexi bacterium]|nr:hypothetical protein [Chloroflexota bacterium]